MKEFEHIVIGKCSIPALILTILLSVAIPVLFVLYWRRKHKQQTGIAWLFVGAVGFIVFSRVLESAVHYVCLIADNPISRFLNGSTAAYVLYGAAMAGVFEECGRHLVIKHLLKKDRSPENAVLYGIGHGGIEVLTVLLPVLLLYLIIAILFSAGNTEKALTALKITEETASAALPYAEAAAAFDFGSMALTLLERLLSMLLHIGLSVVVYYGVVGVKKAFLPLAILLHMLADVFAALYQRGAVPVWSVEAWLALWTAVTGFIAVRLYKKMKGTRTTD